MGTERKVAVITGASQGIGAALVKAYRDRNYRVVATARSVKPSRDDASWWSPATSPIGRRPSA
jgi:NAD(P)-dependent dehydrogenase (short-subunit alcohol dehydrogenase family)